MIKKLILSLAFLQSLSAGAAQAAAPTNFLDLHLIRVYYERTTGTSEVATDLGLVSDLIKGATVAGTLPAAGNAANLNAVYFAWDKTNNHIWASGSPYVPQVAVGSGYNSAKGSFATMQSYYANTLGGGSATTVTGVQSNPASYRTKLSGTRGYLGNAVVAPGNGYTEISLASLVNGSGATSVTQALYYIDVPGTAGTIGSEIGSITTNADGSTTVGPPKTHQTIGAISLPATLTAGGTTNAGVSATSGLTVTLATTTPAVCSVSGNLVTIAATATAGNSCVITADQIGDGTFYAAKQVTNTILVVNSQTIGPLSFVPPTLSVTGTTVVSATATSGFPVTYSSLTPLTCSVADNIDPITVLPNGSATVTGLAAGACSVAADQSGGPVTNPAPRVTGTITVDAGAGPANQTIGPISLTPQTLSVGGSSTASATATSNLPVAFSSTTPLTCSVTAILDLTTHLITYTVNGLIAGDCIIAADQPGDTNWNPAPQVTRTITVLTPQAIGPISLSPPNLTAGSSTTASAVANSGLAVIFDTTTPTICSVTGTGVSGLLEGICTITANQPGDAIYAAAPQVTHDITIIPPFIKIDAATVPLNTLNAALATPQANASIYLQAIPLFEEKVVMSNPALIHLYGGYTDAGFSNQTSTSTIKGKLSIQAGSGGLKVSKINVR
jgi:hypothetical protein